MKTYDLVIIGSGPAGMTAAIYGVRANLSVFLLDKIAPGGQVVYTNEVENYPSWSNINGAELAIKMFEHCQKLGVEFDYKTVKNIDVNGDIKTIYCEENDDVIKTHSIIIATGTTPRKLGLQNEDKFSGTSISWCAICDGSKFKEKDVVLIGGGNSAVDEGIYLAGIVNTLTIITDFDLTADPSSCDYLRSLSNVTVYPYKKILDFVEKDGKLSGVHFCNKEDPKDEAIVHCDGVFEYIGAVPNTKFIENLGILDRGYIVTNNSCETSIPGVYGAGDCIVKELRQIVTATSDGAIAAQKASEYKKYLLSCKK